MNARTLIYSRAETRGQQSVRTAVRGGTILSWLAVAVLFSVPCFADEGRILITQNDLASPPCVITNPGTYVVVENLSVSSFSVNGIDIEADGVTIDLNGHTLAGPGMSAGSGIYQSSNYSSLAVYNGVLRGWAATDEGGIIAFGRNNRIEGIRAIQNGTGIRAGPGSVVTFCTAYSNTRYGIDVENGVVEKCAPSRNLQIGIVATDASVVRDCAAFHNDSGAGVQVANSTVVGCAVRQNRGAGVYALAASSISEACATLNTNEGIYATKGSVIERSLVRENGGAGIRGNTDCTIRDSVSRGNEGSGIRLSRRCSVEDCVVSLNDQFGIDLFESCRAQGNTVFINGEVLYGTGIEFNGTGNRIQANHVTFQSNGISTAMSGNVIVKNSCLYNKNDNYQISSGATNIVGAIRDSALLWQMPWANFEVED